MAERRRPRVGSEWDVRFRGATVKVERTDAFGADCVYSSGSKTRASWHHFDQWVPLSDEPWEDHDAKTTLDRQSIDLTPDAALAAYRRAFNEDPPAGARCYPSDLCKAATVLMPKASDVAALLTQTGHRVFWSGGCEWPSEEPKKTTVRVGQEWGGGTRYPNLQPLKVAFLQEGYAWNATHDRCMCLSDDGTPENDGWTLIRDVEEPSVHPDRAARIAEASRAINGDESGDYAPRYPETHQPPSQSAAVFDCAGGLQWLAKKLGIGVDQIENKGMGTIVVQAATATQAAVIRDLSRDWIPMNTRLEIVVNDDGKWPAEAEKPLPRPQQRWNDGCYEFAVIDHYGEDGLDWGHFILMRRDDGLRVEVSRRHLHASFTFVSGPTEPETPRAAIERVVKLEAEYVPAGCTAGWWLANLIGDAEHNRGGNAGIAVTADYVRQQARIKRGSLGAWENAVRWEAER